MHSSLSLCVVALLALFGFARAGFNTDSSTNVAIYWGQNSADQANSQQRLGYYCSNDEFDMVQLAFLLSIQTPVVNFANAGNNCTLFPGTELLDCPQLEEDILTCQSTYGKTILLSIGGATYTEGGFPSEASAIAAANNIWAMFGPVQTDSGVNRPFGNAVIDGFDFDFESTVSNMIPFGQQLRSLMNSVGGKPYYLTAAPQCPYPDAADGPMLAGQVYFDAVLVQFYNNYCGVQSYVAGASTQNNFNFDTWDNWAHTVSLNPDVKVLLGVPGSPSAAGSGYLSASALAPVISYCQDSFSSFGGVMTWDMSQVFYTNPGWLDGVTSDLQAGSGSGPPPPPPPPPTSILTTTTITPTTLSTITTKVPPTTTTNPTTPCATLVPEYSQCGGNGYTGCTQCVAPYSCIPNSVWWSQCGVAS